MAYSGLALLTPLPVGVHLGSEVATAQHHLQAIEFCDSQGVLTLLAA